MSLLRTIKTTKNDWLARDSTVKSVSDMFLKTLYKHIFFNNL